MKGACPLFRNLLSAFRRTPSGTTALLGPGSSPHTTSSLASFRKPFLINPGGTAAKPITPERPGGRGEAEADIQGHRHPEGRAARPPVPPAPRETSGSGWGADMAVLGSGGSYTVGDGTSRPQEARGPCTQARLQPRQPARGPVRGSPERRVKAAWLEGRERGVGGGRVP